MGLLSDDTVTIELEVEKDALEDLQRNCRHDRYGLLNNISSGRPHDGVNATVTDDDVRMDPDDDRTITEEEAIEHAVWCLAENRLNWL